MPNLNLPVIALDARLIGTTSTGDATYWRGLVAGLAEIDCGFRFLLFANKPHPDAVPVHPSFEWVHLPAASSRWWSLVRFPLAARRLGARAIHTQYNLSPLCGRIGITTVHDVSFRIDPSWFQPRDRILLNRFVGGSIRRAARVLTVSETSRLDIVRHFPSAEGKIVATPLACGLGIRPMEREEARSTVERELGSSGPYLLTVGTRWPRKNMQLALDAFDAVGDGSLKLAVTGKPGWGEEEVPQGAVTTGYVSDAVLSALYSGAEMYLAPSRYEGFGLTLLEAMACACPVLCSSGGAHPEVAGDAARVMPTWGASEWAQAIRESLADSSTLDRMRAAGRKRVQEFSWKKTAEKTLAVYREVAQ